MVSIIKRKRKKLFIFLLSLLVYFFLKMKVKPLPGIMHNYQLFPPFPNSSAIKNRGSKIRDTR